MIMNNRSFQVGCHYFVYPIWRSYKYISIDALLSKVDFTWYSIKVGGFESCVMFSFSRHFFTRPTMQSNTLLIAALLAVMLVIMPSCHGKRFFRDDDNDGMLELTQAKARSFLQDSNDESDDVDKRVNSGDCVLCKFNKITCCRPNICIKKRFRPDECMEIKGK